jgi:hypothetical protein
MNSAAGAPKTVAPVQVKIEPEDPAPTPITGDGLSVDGFKKAIESKDKAAINVYRKVLSKSNKKLARKADHTSRINPWNAHVAAYRQANPHLKFKEVLQQAKATYKK